MSYVKFTYIGISLNQLSGLAIACDLPPAGGSCAITSGDQVIAANGFDQYSIPMCAGVLLAFIVACRLLAYAGLRVRKH
jgi:ATP-binding cassette, subfamily G (WHITE), member 2